MKFILIIGSILAPLFMLILQKINPKLRLLFHIVAVIAALVFGNISSLAIYKIIKDHTVFMTSIHGIFLNPFFLISGAYLGTYFIYRMVLWTIDDQKNRRPLSRIKQGSLTLCRIPN